MIAPTFRSSLAILGTVVAGLCLAALPTLADVSPHGGMLRYPAVSSTQIAFSYAGDIWLVPREGGVATPLASPPGTELFPRFSPDGKQIAFVGSFNGENGDIYVMPVGGGIPFQVTHHPSVEQLRGWTPDGKLLFSVSGLGGLRAHAQIFTVSPEGGMPQQLPVVYGGNPAISPDGVWLAYTPFMTDFRTWKRYRGGMASDIWLLNLKDLSSRRITDWEGTDTLPMWQGKTVYYLSDNGPEHRLNIWAFDTVSGKRRQVTQFKDFDIKWPSIGPGPDGKGEIVFQKGSGLFLLNLASDQPREVKVTIPGARPTVRPQVVNAAHLVFSYGISPSAKRAVLEARGDIWTVPAQDGSARNLTRTAGVAERFPTWSPDGRWIAYISDESGDYELYVRPADNSGTPRALTHNSKTFYSNIVWAPDSKWLLFQDDPGNLALVDVEKGEVKLVDKNPGGNRQDFSISHDGAWIAFNRSEDFANSALWLYEVATGKKQAVAGNMFRIASPAFDREGKFLYAQIASEFSSPEYEDFGTTFIYTNTNRLIAFPLRNDVASPLLPKSDEDTTAADKEKEKEKDKAKDEKKDEKKPDAAAKGEPKDGKKAEKSDKDAKAEDKPKEPLKIDIDGFEARAILLPVGKGRFNHLVVNDKNQLLYLRGIARGDGDADGDGEGGNATLQLFDPNAETKERKEKVVLAGVNNFDITPDGKKLIVSKAGQYSIIDSQPDQKTDKPLSLDMLKTEIDPRAEWREVFNDAWRRERDQFYVRNMHGNDWDKIHQQYAAMLDDCYSRDDLSYIISEMISELNIGHAYYGASPEEIRPGQSVGLLGADFALENGAYKITRILTGGPWDVDARSPLAQPGLKVKTGDYLLAVNGVPIDVKKDIWAAFVGLAGKTVTLTVSAKPVRDKDAQDIVVKPIPAENMLRYRAWVEANRRYVAEKTGGKVGYIYVPNTGTDGQNELFRQFYAQMTRGALIIDERWNGGGQIPTRFIELLNRPITNYWARRDGFDWPWPYDSHQGPKCMLINGMAGSGGDAFPWYFRQAKLGKLIGRRTWGGLVGISGAPPMIDGSAVTVPDFGFYKKDGTWGIEGHGVDPDIEVLDDPALLAKGIDPQLDQAIAVMLDELKKNPYTPPQRPAAPDHSGMGVPERDR